MKNTFAIILNDNNMKRPSNVLAIALIAAIGLSSCKENTKDEEKIPENIQSAFKQKFPNAANVKWEKNCDNTWEAEFVMTGNKHSAQYKPDSNWYETEYVITISKVPDVIKANVASRYPGYKIVKAEVVITSWGEQYELQLNKEQTSIGVFYTGEGAFMGQEKEH